MRTKEMKGATRHRSRVDSRSHDHKPIDRDEPAQPQLAVVQCMYITAVAERSRGSCRNVGCTDTVRIAYDGLKNMNANVFIVLDKRGRRGELAIQAGEAYNIASVRC